MREDLLYSDPPTLDDWASKHAIRDIFRRTDWIKFSNMQNDQFDYWLKRYLSLHAKVPSLFSATDEPVFIPAMVPLATFKTISNSGVIYDGGGFSNGAVVRIRAKGNFLLKILFVEEQIVKLFNYDLVPIKRIELKAEDLPYDFQ